MRCPVVPLATATESVDVNDDLPVIVGNVDVVADSVVADSVVTVAVPLTVIFEENVRFPVTGACASRVTQSDRPVAMSLKFVFTAEDRMVVPGMNEFMMEKLLEPLKEISPSYCCGGALACDCARARASRSDIWSLLRGRI